MEPEIIRQKLLVWYDANQRRLPWRETSDPYAIWVSEVMLQQTQVATALPYYRRFMECFPTARQLAEADLQAVLKLWEGLGYYSRARHLHRAAGMVAARFDGNIPNDPDQFRSLPGVGDYILAAVSSIAFGRVIPVVDGNVKRVLSRLLEIDTPVNRSNAHKFFQKPADRLICPQRPGDFNQAIMELGALVCRPKNPDCRQCPLADFCQACLHGTIPFYPKRTPSVKIPQRHMAVGVILKKGKLLVVQRAANGLLGGLWEFPAVPADTGGTPPAAFEATLAAQTGLKVAVEQRLPPIRHVYTHFRLTADIFLCRHVAGRVRLKSPQNHQWVTLASLDRLPQHKANQKVLEALKHARALMDK